MDTGQGGIARANAPDPTSGSVEAAQRQPGRPFILWILTLALLASPLIHAVALLLHTRWLNFGSVRPWDGFRLLPHRPNRRRADAATAQDAGPLLGVCVPPRARSFERFGSTPPVSGCSRIGFLVVLQLPASRRLHPSVDPNKVLARLRLRRTGRRGAA